MPGTDLPHSARFIRFWVDSQRPRRLRWTTLSPSYPGGSSNDPGRRLTGFLPNGLGPNTAPLVQHSGVQR